MKIQEMTPWWPHHTAKLGRVFDSLFKAEHLTFEQQECPLEASGNSAGSSQVIVVSCIASLTTEPVLSVKVWLIEYYSNAL